MKKEQCFPFLQKKEQRQQWIKFLRRQDSHSLKNIFICYKHFAEDLIKKTPKRVKLIHNLEPVPNIITKSQNPMGHPTAAVLQNIKSGRKTLKERLFRLSERMNLANLMRQTK